MVNLDGLIEIGLFFSAMTNWATDWNLLLECKRQSVTLFSVMLSSDVRVSQRTTIWLKTLNYTYCCFSFAKRRNSAVVIHHGSGVGCQFTTKFSALKILTHARRLS